MRSSLARPGRRASRPDSGIAASSTPAPTSAVLFRLIHEFRPTLLLDEMEALGGEQARDVLAVINAGYQAGATVPRVEGKDTRRVKGFPVYAPLACAAIRAPNPTTADRCIPVVMLRGRDRIRSDAAAGSAEAGGPMPQRSLVRCSAQQIAVRQPGPGLPGVLHVILNVIEFQVHAPRGSAARFSAISDIIDVPNPILRFVTCELEGQGEKVARSYHAFAGGHAIKAGAGAWAGGADPSHDGMALAV